MRDHWELEFVGGPLDGRHDIEVPVEQDGFIYQTCAPIPVCTPASEVPVSSLLFNHLYRRGRMRKCGPEWDAQGNGYWQETIWDVWLYHRTGQ